MLLLVDIGNSYIKLKTEDSEIYYIRTGDVDSLSSLNNLFPLHLSYDEACISSVAGKEEIFNEYFTCKGINALIIDTSLKFNIEYPKARNELGADLLALMEGCALKSDTFIGISLGTASVFLYVMNKKFMGCAICPGLETSFKSLIANTTLLGSSYLTDDFDLLGFNTIDSVRDGMLMGHTLMIDGYIDEIKKKFNTVPDVYMMGGMTQALSRKLKNNVFIDQNLIFKGMETIYKNNKSVK